MTIIHRVDYLSEREATAIRCNAFGRSGWWEDLANMTFVFNGPDGHVPVRSDVAIRFMDDWRRSGAWSLHGRDYLEKEEDECMSAEHNADDVCQAIDGVLAQLAPESPEQ